MYIKHPSLIKLNTKMGKQTFIFSLLLFLSLMVCPAQLNKKIPVFYICIVRPLEFSLENLVMTIKESDIKHKDIFLAQIIKETGNYTSDVFLNANNLCGMRFPVRRETLAIGTYKGYALYEHWEHSIDDYYIWQKPIVLKHKTRESFLSYIGRVYAKDSLYLSSIKGILYKNRQYFTKVFK